MLPILSKYLKIHKALAGDSVKGVPTVAKSIVESAARLDVKSVTGEHRNHYRAIPTELKKSATALANAASLSQARDAFKALSKPMAMWASMSRPFGVDVVFCSMAGASWLQKSGEIKNPYYGKSMLNCGDVVSGTGSSKKSADRRKQDRVKDHSDHSKGSSGHMMMRGRCGH
jgi:Cu(I)/Ag(I) efflux system membrane fusion protein